MQLPPQFKACSLEEIAVRSEMQIARLDKFFRTLICLMSFFFVFHTVIMWYACELQTLLKRLLAKNLNCCISIKPKYLERPLSLINKRSSGILHKLFLVSH